MDFSDADFFALVGPTGSGKSTVIDAICFALYGSAPRWPRANQVSLALAGSVSHCRVSLVFDLAGRRFAVTRVLGRRPAVRSPPRRPGSSSCLATAAWTGR